MGKEGQIRKGQNLTFTGPTPSFISQLRVKHGVKDHRQARDPDDPRESGMTGKPVDKNYENTVDDKPAVDLAMLQGVSAEEAREFMAQQGLSEEATDVKRPKLPSAKSSIETATVKAATVSKPVTKSTKERKKAEKKWKGLKRPKGVKNTSLLSFDDE